MKRRLLFIFAFGAIGAAIALVINPVNSTLLRVAFVGSLVLSWLGVLAITWKSRWFRAAFVLLPLLLAAPFLLPAKDIAREEMRDDFVDRMLSYEGTRYYWGGENGKGIDCSGLPRRAFREALFRYGLKNLDGGPLRAAVENWWFDASAKALSEGYRDYTVSMNRGGTISEMDYSGLRAGDLAITDGGAHMLAYVGEGKWIQADPGLGVVAVLHGKDDENFWFDGPVGIYRWTRLAE